MAALSVIYSNFCGTVVSETRSGVESDYVPDTLGSTIGLMGSVGTMTDRWEYWPYGEVVSRTGTNVTPLTFLGVLGYFQDVLSKLFYVRARHLRPDLGRWLTTDPLWPFQGAYIYVDCNPIAASDSSGMYKDCSSMVVSPMQRQSCSIAASYFGQKCLGGSFCRAVVDIQASGSLTFDLNVIPRGILNAFCYIGSNDPCTLKLNLSCNKHIDLPPKPKCPPGQQCLKSKQCRYDSTTFFSDPGPINDSFPSRVDGKPCYYSISNIRYTGTVHASATAFACKKPTVSSGGS